jgi:hypothetical protein
MTPQPSSRSSRVDGVIDLSNLASPRDVSWSLACFLGISCNQSITM